MNIEKGNQEETLQGKLRRKRPEHASPTGERRHHVMKTKDVFRIKDVVLWPDPRKLK